MSKHKIHPNKREGSAKLDRIWIHSCGKYGYGSRKAARVGERLTRHTINREKSADGLSAYKCEGCERYHIGHLPKAVRDGDVSRHEHYSRPGVGHARPKAGLGA